MTKYWMVAWAAKAFSMTPGTRRLYRRLGNVVLQRQRLQAGLPPRYVERARRLIQICEKYQVVKPGDRVLEVGTGWVHWEATILRLFYDVKLTLFDVVDNHLLSVYKEYLQELDRVIDRELALSPSQSERVHPLLRALYSATSFEEIFDLLDAEYIIHPAGTLNQFPNKEFAAIVSCDVLEHIDRDILPEFLRDSFRLLQPGGYAIHQIDLSDHYAYFDPSASRKNYYQYSDKAWARYFDSVVQYVNRVQRPEWSELFCQAGFELVEQELEQGDIASIKIDPRYQNLSKQDLECLVMRVVYRRPK